MGYRCIRVWMDPRRKPATGPVPAIRVAEPGANLDTWTDADNYHGANGDPNPLSEYHPYCDPNPLGDAHARAAAGHAAGSNGDRAADSYPDSGCHAASHTNRNPPTRRDPVLHLGHPNHGR